MSYIVTDAYRRSVSSGCLSGCGVQTPARRRLGIDWAGIVKAAPVVASSAAEVTNAFKGGGGGAPGKQTSTGSSNASSGGGAGNFIDRLSSTELAIGAIGGLGLVLALVR